MILTDLNKEKRLKKRDDSIILEAVELCKKRTKCQKIYADDFDYNLYFSAINSFITSAFCCGEGKIKYKAVEKYLFSIVTSYSQKINIERPNVAWIASEDLSTTLAYANRANYIAFKPLNLCDYKERNKKNEIFYKKMCYGGVDFDIENKLKYINSQLSNERECQPVSLLECAIHELTHINQFAYQTELMQGKNIDSVYGKVGYMYDILNALCIAKNENYIENKYKNFHYFYCLHEFEARIRTTNELMRLNKNNVLNEDVRQSILDIHRLNVFNEIEVLNGANGCEEYLKYVANYTKDEFVKLYKDSNYANKIVEEFDDLLESEEFNKQLKNFDLQFEENLKYALEAEDVESESPLSDLAKLGIELTLQKKINKKEKKKEERSL